MSKIDHIRVYVVAGYDRMSHSYYHTEHYNGRYARREHYPDQQTFMRNITKLIKRYCAVVEFRYY